ncbi:cyclopropane-fatty-acyl-phospholipid synthase family protein [Variovorax dokdonensis]|uniref:Cyclopropane-fatty-acyl-phospholipid synthase family protein n=1 Tax=Variovorax dokdonensis TaxID=344883 RepID=A0ABT7N992_9BURK|nr:cyclopropane-fatty-acyl-phospholipid synthase family protein [Variovorax dokdonensis]MDM0044496.1 cyclopropane-fatty-acyl-phospholipid synthase family protein [Variovorax dokdonensis]
MSRLIFNTARTSEASISAGPGLPWTWRGQIQRALAGLQRGSLDLTLPNGERISVRGRVDGAHATVHVHRWRALRRLLSQGDLGWAESYCDGDWSTPDLVGVLEFGLANESAMGNTLTGNWLARAWTRVRHLLNANTPAGSRRNISAHYDLGNTFYGTWLDPQMIYSSAIYAPGDLSLEQAQERKLSRIESLLQLEGGERVLEIGCGWGALAMKLAANPGVHVTGVTLSREQLAHANAQVEAAGLRQSVELRLQDYRDIEGTFDRIVSIEMLEAVGQAYWPRYFQTLRDRMKPGGTAVVQVILIDDAHFDAYSRNPDFIQRHVFPGGMLPCDAALRQQAQQAGLQLECTDRFGASYARTVQEWRQRFEAAWPLLRPLGFDERFRRMWNYYLGYCEVGFRNERIDVALYRITHSPQGQTA